ncbi:tetratricopeptide repeat protein [Aulosira sp. FACHB-615]|uniref:tetratricopeptide repeat protein n=1 Tax=Aulosira sp. FACHB-615 TaxID=2692777 RepID=UPI001682D522|nr:tetratricopeptide repeat protein [Aulosira sp. FACHB-615]MBD2489828.1 tetratricopeptide repeat protein [Aulosira sp. FACHB-615]
MGALKYYCYRRQDIMDSDRIYQLINQAEELVQTGEYKLGISVFQQALQIDPRNVEALRQYAKSLTHIQEFEQAFQVFEQALEIDPNNVDTLRNYGTTLGKSGRENEALSIFEKALEIKPRDIKVLFSYSTTLKKLGKNEQLICVFEKLIELDPQNSQLLTKYANALVNNGQHDKAFHVFERSLKIEPSNPRILNSYANVLFSNGRYEKALQIFERSLEIEPHNQITLSRYANTFAAIGEYEQAFIFFDKSLQIEANNLITLSKYAIALNATGKYQQALPFFDQWLRTKFQNSDGLNSYIYFQYALALEGRGKYEDAIEKLLAIKIEILSPYQANVIQLHLGRLHYCIKQPEKGNEYFEAAIANSDDKDKTRLYSARSILANNPHSQTAVEMLQQISKDSPRYAEAFEMLTLNSSEEEYFDMVKTDTQTGLIDTEMLNRAMYHKIANEIGILKGIAYRILRHSELQDPLLSCIIQDIEDVFEEVNRRRAAQKSEIETISHDDYGKILAVISKTAHDISDFVNNQLAVIESKTRRAIRKLQPKDVHYTQLEKLLAQLELTQTALSDLKAINEGITIKNHRFKVKKLFEKWETTPRIDQAQIMLEIQNGDSEFYGDEEKIKSALNELVENSLKHNSEQQNLIIRISSQDVINPLVWGRTIPGEQKYLFIEFADNGKGIPEDKKDWIFQPLKTTSHEGKGSGLGLFIIRKTLTKMNGYIRETGYNGSIFEIYIPYTKGELH